MDAGLLAVEEKADLANLAILVERLEFIPTMIKVLASVLAAAVAGFVGSEFLEAVARTKDERSQLALICLSCVFGLWACWEVKQIREHLGLASRSCIC